MSGTYEHETGRKAPTPKAPSRRQVAPIAPNFPATMEIDPMVGLCALCAVPYRSEPKFCPDCVAMVANLGDAFERDTAIDRLKATYVAMVERSRKGEDVITEMPSSKREQPFRMWRYLIGNIERLLVLMDRVAVVPPAV